MAICVGSALELYEIFLSFLLAYNTTFLEDSFERNLCCSGLSDGHRHEEVSLGNRMRVGFRKLQAVTVKINWEKGDYGNVYKGLLGDSTVVAVKSLKDGNVLGEEIQSQSEVKLISLAFGKASNHKGSMLDWVKKIHQEKKLEVLEEMVRVVLLCTVFLGHRPKMSKSPEYSQKIDLRRDWKLLNRSDM
ncbi:hypothetical protein YC2023_005531 [Brassica napus]